MKILVYGFGPYREFSDNITEKILRLLPDLPDVEKRIFDVRFDRDMFERAFERAQPDVILGLGQHPRASRIQHERRAKDVRSEDGKQHDVISGSGHLSMSLELPEHELLEVSDDAGEYVCNFSMYVAELYARRAGIRAGFLHIPSDAEVRNAVELIGTILKRLQERSNASNEEGPLE